MAEAARATGMDIQFLGATDTVTGSRYLVRQGGSSVLVDCGLFQGYKQLRLRNWGALPVEPSSIHAVVLTHAHIDHSGYLPLLVRNGFRGTIHATAATRELCAILLKDCGHLQEEEAEYANRHHSTRHAPALPLYTQEDAREALKLFRVARAGADWDLAPGIKARLASSGHMPGSAFVRLEGGGASILFSGDLGRPHDLLLKPPSPRMAADYLVVESTYGDRLHENADPLRKLADIINRTTARHGTVVIPAFAVGRAQTLLYCIQQLKLQGLIPDVPVFLNSPMAASATDVLLHHRGELRLGEHECNALANVATIIRSADESRALNVRKGPMVIISASGMATGGRVLHHLKAFAPYRRNTILLSGFQAGGTRGASIAAGARSVRIFGEDVPIHAEVASLDLLSSHADAAEILGWLRGGEGAPAKVFITHGEPHAADALRQRIERELGWNCHMPTYLERVMLAPP